MTESLTFHDEERPLDWKFASQVLGIEITDPSMPPEVYDERRVIVQDVHAAAFALRERMVAAAQAAGIELTENEIEQWQPTEPEQLAQLQASLKNQRRMLRILDGLLDLENQTRDIEREGVPLRKHQETFTQDICDFVLYAPRTPGSLGKSGVVEGPTGIGKTAIFSKIAARVQYNDLPDDPTRVLVLVPTEKIREQTMGEKGTRGFGKFAPHLDVGAYPVEKDSLQRGVTVMCNASFNSLCAQGKLPDYPVVIVDEVDTILGSVTSENLRQYMADRLVIGLSATTETGGKSVYDLFEHTISRLKLTKAIRSGLLAPTRGFLLKAEPKIDPFSLPEDPNQRRLALRQARLEARMEIAKKIIKEAVEAGDGVIVRCPAGEDVGYAVDYAAQLRDIMIRDDQGLLGGIRWIVAGHVGGSARRQSKEERNTIFEGYDTGRVDVLTYVKAIGRGYDSPRAKVFINLDPSTSMTEMVQALGRIVRLIFDDQGRPCEARAYDFEDPELGNKQRTCLDVLETVSGELIDHDPTEADEPRPRNKAIAKPHAEILEVKTSTIASVAVGHEVKVEPPSAEEINATIVAYKGDEDIPIDEVCRILGVTLPTLKSMLEQSRSSPDGKVRIDHIKILLEKFPGIQARRLPETGYTAASDVARRINGVGFVRSFNLIAFAQAEGLFPERFRDPETDIIGHYWNEEMATEVVKRYEDTFGNKKRKRK